MSQFQVFYLHRSSQCPLKSHFVKARLIKEGQCVGSYNCQNYNGQIDTEAENVIFSST